MAHHKSFNRNGMSMNKPSEYPRVNGHQQGQAFDRLWVCILLVLGFATALIAILSVALPAIQFVISAIAIVVVLGITFWFFLAVLKLGSAIERLVFTVIASPGATLLLFGGIGGIKGFVLQPQFPYVQPAEPQISLVLIGIAVLFMALAAILFLRRMLAAPWIITVLALITLAFSVCWVTPIEEKLGVEATLVKLRIHDPSTKKLEVDGDSFVVFDAFNVSIENSYRRVRRGDVHFWSSINSSWGRVKPLDLSSFKNGKEILEMNSVKYPVKLPDKQINATYQQDIKARVYELAEGISQCNYSLGHKKALTEDYWSKRIDNYDKVDLLQFEFPKPEVTLVKRIQKFENDNANASTYELTSPTEYTVEELEDIIRVSIPNPRVGYSYRVFVEVNQE